VGRIIGIDYGLKRVGIAVTDPLKILASPLTTVNTSSALEFVHEYCKKEKVETIVIGMPLRLNGEETHSTRPALEFGDKLKKKVQGVKIDWQDEQFTSKKAVEAMVAGGMKKKDRRKKENIDKISAALILRSYLEER
jgi:putative Holliday junction resolvase